MIWFKRKSPRPSEEFYANRLDFLGEQDGPPEQILKENLADFFRDDGNVNRAYLARVSYDGGVSASVVLGLRTTSEDEVTLVEKVGVIFASFFKAKEHLDTVFLTDEIENRLMKVCRPFFVKDGHASKSD
jgi:hypothetical protein